MDPLFQTVPNATLEFSFDELRMLAQAVEIRAREPYWEKDYKGRLASILQRIRAKIDELETPFKEAEILRKADEIRARRANQTT